MKKIKIFLGILILMFVLSSGSYHHFGHSVKCAKCVEQAKKWPGHYVNIAVRTTDPYQTIDGKVYAKYHCYGGHYYWAEIN